MDRPTSRARASRLPARGDDSGQILVLTLGLTLVVLLLVTVIVSLTGIHLERKRLLDLADNLALAAADAMTEEVIYGAGVTSLPPGGVPDDAAGPSNDVTSDTGLALTDEAVAEAVSDYLATHPRALDGLSDVVVVLAHSPDGRSAHVVLTSRAQPALISPVTSLFSDGVTLTAQSTARVW